MCASCQKVDFKVACFPRKFRALPGSLISPTVHSAAAEQANCIWLSSGETMTLNFLKKSMPRMGPATAACRKVDVKSLP